MKRGHHQLYAHRSVSSSSSGGGASIAGVSKESDAAGMDELLAVLGYRVRSSEMAEVAQKLEQLEEVIGSAAAREDDLSDIVHYNPSDLSNWLDTMLSELNPPLSDFNPLLDDAYFTPAESSTTMTSQIFDDSSNCDYDLKAIPGKAIYSAQLDQSSSTNSKRFKTDVPCSSESSFWGNPNPKSLPVVSMPLDSSSRPALLILHSQQENGIRLVHTLTICAQAIQQENLKMAEVLVKQIEFLATTQVGAMGKVAAYFAKALALRIDGGFSPPKNTLDSLLYDNLLMHFYDTCPYLKFAHFTANQAILEAFAGKSRVHVLDFSLKQGMQWPALMHALALRPGGPPSFRLTAIGSSSSENPDQVGWKLAQFAKTVNVDFQYRGFAAKSLSELDASSLDLLPGESLAVNSIFDMHTSLAVEGEIERVLASLKEMDPEIVTIVEQEANHNGQSFSDRFSESLHYYSAMFDSLEATPANGDGRVLSEAYLGRQICNVVACEGTERVERHEQLVQWRERFKSAGFSPRFIGSNAYRQASLLLEVFAGGEGYGVEEREGCLLLGWHSRPLIATSAWQIRSRRGAFRI